MRGTAALEPPFDDPVTLASTRGPGRSALAALWRRRRDYLELRRPIVGEICARDTVPLAIPTSWVLALLWDELARRDLTEAASDWLLGKVGRDPSVGPYQVTGRTGLDVVDFVPWGTPYRTSSPAQMRELLLDFTFATRVVVGRAQQIVTHWRRAGHDPLVEGGLGEHRLSPIALVGTLYSQGLGQPKPNPRPNPRGRQIALFAQKL